MQDKQVFVPHKKRFNDKGLFVLHSQHHGCWWPGDARSNCIRSNGSGVSILEYSGFNKPWLLALPGRQHHDIDYADYTGPCVLWEKFQLQGPVYPAQGLKVDFFLFRQFINLHDIDYNQLHRCCWPGNAVFFAILTLGNDNKDIFMLVKMNPTWGLTQLLKIWIWLYVWICFDFFNKWFELINFLLTIPI